MSNSLDALCFTSNCSLKRFGLWQNAAVCLHSMQQQQHVAAGRRSNLTVPSCQSYLRSASADLSCHIVALFIHYCLCNLFGSRSSTYIPVLSHECYLVNASVAPLIQSFTHCCRNYPPLISQLSAFLFKQPYIWTSRMAKSRINFTKRIKCFLLC